ncbi:MAG: hypothetical protein GY869_03110, partial [Planctomycetes bacterium]|nr:hypothetical protein [Planctomycetota bacterium]
STGAFAVEVTGVDDSTSGDYQLDIYLPGDIDQDGDIDGVDEVLFDTVGFEATSDVDRDGDIDSVDRQFINLNFAFVADQMSQVADASFETYRGIPITLDLSSLTEDTHTEALGYLITNIQHGAVINTGDGQSIMFVPETGFDGIAGFNFQAHDGVFLSDTAHIAVDINSAALVSIQLAQRNLLLESNEPQSLIVMGEFADQQMIELPLSYTQFVSTDPDVCLVTENGMLWPLADGIATIIITAEGITAATPVTVGDPGISPQVEFYPTSYTLTPNTTRQFIVRENQSNVPVQDRSAAADGTTYYISNSSVGTITADGLFTALSTGTTEVTVIYSGQSTVATIAVVNPDPGPTTVNQDGGIVSNADGYQILIPPDALPDGTVVELTTLVESDMPMALPLG